MMTKVRTMITKFWHQGRQIYRSHIWNSDGYSTGTHANLGEAQAHVDSYLEDV